MKNLKKCTILLLALIMCLGLGACKKKLSINDLTGYWYPEEGIGSTTSVLTCIYINGATETWEEFDEYGDSTGCAGAAYTDGKVLTLTDVPSFGDVEIPIGAANELLTDDGETYWIKGQPDFKEKPELDLSTFSNRWYLKGDHDSEYATILTLNEDGTYTKGDIEEGTYTYREFEEYVGDTGTTVFRREISLSGGFMAENYYLVSDGQVLVHWAAAANGSNYYINEDALGNEQLLAECILTEGTFLGETYGLCFARDYTMKCVFLDGITEDLTGTWELSDDTVTIIWNDGETDEATLSPGNPDTLTIHSTGEILENPFDF